MGIEELDGRVAAVIAESGFSGVVRVDVAGETLLERAVGWAHRAHRVPMAIDTRLATASGTKGLTALTVLSLAADGSLPLATPARELLGPDLPLVDDRVTVEHLLAHRSGIGDHLDEDAAGPIDEHVLAVPVHTLATTEAYLAVLDGHPQAFAPDERFAYCNGGYVVLSLLAERATGTPFADLVAERTCGPAGMGDTAFLRSDDLPAGTATGYLHATGNRTNVLHLPVRGSGDGGAHTTVADVHRLWAASTRPWRPGRGRPAATYPRRPCATASASGSTRAAPPWREGYDAGVSFRSVHDPVAGTTHTVISNWSDGAWPLARLLRQLIDDW